jgi:hypothetical protein
MEDIHHLFLIGEVEAMNFIGSVPSSSINKSTDSKTCSSSHYLPLQICQSLPD